MRSRLVSVALAPIAVAVLLIAALTGPGTALALPSGCHLSTTTGSVAAHCSSGTGYYRARAKLRWSSGAYSYRADDWVRAGCCGESYVNAPSGSRVVAGYLDVRS